MNKTIRNIVYQKYDGHCAYCGVPLDMKDMQIDHQRPIHLGGSNNIDNLYPSCRRCNHYKRSWTLEQYRELILKLRKKIKNIYLVKVGIDYGLLKINDDDFSGVFYFEKPRAGSGA